MAFEVFSEKFVDQEDAADISLIVAAPDFRGLSFEVPLVGREFVGAVEWPREFRAEIGPVTVTLQGVFKRNGGTAGALVLLPSFDFLEGIRVRQTAPDYIEGRVTHREELRHTGHFFYAYGSEPQRAVLDQCTVVCPSTGESRSGRNVCIECKCKRGTVKICC